MTAEPAILLIVPTLDSWRQLPRLVQSLQGQSWPHWQVLFIDGPSGPEHRHWLQQLCDQDGRFNWQPQDPGEPGIFGAMNQGFAAAPPSSWVLFWGSDDWAAGPDVFANAADALIADGLAADALTAAPAPDLLICRGRYADAASGQLGRRTAFHWSHSYRRSLALGFTPPHQATLIGPGARARLARYAPGFRLSADLDYFLQLSAHPDLAVVLRDLELVHMGDGGISGQQTRRRLQEVRCAYRRAFGRGWGVPFLLRYLYRLGTVVIQRQRATTSRQ